MTEDQLRGEIINLGGSKATPIGDISVDIHLTFIRNSACLL